MNDFVVDFPFAYEADLRFKRKRTFVREELVARVEVAVPRASGADVPAALVLPDRGARPLAFLHDGTHFWKPFQHGPSEADFAASLSDRDGRVRVKRIEEYPLPQFKGTYREYASADNAFNLTTSERHVGSLDVSEVANSTFDEMRRRAVAAASERLLSVDGIVHVRCREPVLEIDNAYGNLHGRVSGWRAVDRFRMPVPARLRAGVDIDVSGSLDVRNEAAFGFDPVAGNVDVVRSFAATLVARLSDLKDHDAEERMRFSRRVLDAFVRARAVDEGRSSDLAGLYASLTELCEGEALHPKDDDRRREGRDFRDALRGMRTFVRTLEGTGYLASATTEVDPELEEALMGMDAA